MFTPQKKVFSGWSLSPRRENQKTPAPNSNSNGRISENGGAIVVRDGNDLEDLDEKTAKLENERERMRETNPICPFRCLENEGPYSSLC